MARSLVSAAMNSAAHGQSCGKRKRTRRPERASLPGRPKSRNRIALI
jgi:hypothetical protein